MRLVGFLLVVLASTGCAAQVGDPQPEDQVASEAPSSTARPVASPTTPKEGEPAVPVAVLQGIAQAPAGGSVASGGTPTTSGGVGGVAASGGMGTDNPNPSPWSGTGSNCNTAVVNPLLVEHE